MCTVPRARVASKKKLAWGRPGPQLELEGTTRTRPSGTYLQVGEFATGVTVGVADGAVGLEDGVGDGDKIGSVTDINVTRKPSIVAATSVEKTADTCVSGVEE